MDDRPGSQVHTKKTNIGKIKKVVERHDRPRQQETRHIEEEKNR